MSTTPIPRCSQCRCISRDVAFDAVWGHLCPTCAIRQAEHDSRSPLRSAPYFGTGHPFDPEDGTL